jgi:hypothetical protein
VSGKLFQRQSASMTAPASKTAIPAGNIHRRPRVAGQELGVPGILLLAVPQAADHLSLLGVVAAIERAAAAEVQPYLRDVQDTLLLVDEEVAARRDLLGTVLEANMAVLSVEQAKISNRQNATMERLTILASIFLPLTFVTGFFGQNFGWLVGHITTFAAFIIYGIGGLVVPAAMLLWWLRRRRTGPDPGTAAGR